MESPDARVEIEESLAHTVPRKPYPQYIDDAVFLEVKELLKQHPDDLSRTWSEKPRLYTLLRMLGYDDDSTVCQKFDTEQIGDYWLPLGTGTLNQLSNSTGLSPQDWRRAQFHVLSKPDLMGEEKLLSPNHAHRHIQYGDSHFEEIEKIGKGGSAEVARVRHKLSGKQFACKRILRANEVKTQRNQLIEFAKEVAVLQRISHHHLVSFVASFTDLTSFSLILNPVAKDVLKSMLDRQSHEEPLPATDISMLRRAFGCIATALAYLHDDQRVRHKDIKPGNILLSEGRVYLCDFGIARDWSKSENSTTEGEVLKFTRRYCAPEVFGHDPRNSSSDIWSLGCVFLEMLSVIKGYTLEDVNDFLLEHSEDASAQGFFNAPEAISAWLVKIRSEKNDSADDVPLDWITPMIRTKPKDRLKASELVTMIHKQSADLPHPDLFLSSCCTRTDSAIPADTVERPSLTEPVYNRSGRDHEPPSPSPQSSYPGLPYRTSGVSVERGFHTPSTRHLSSRDRSQSPQSQSPGPRDSTETAASSTNPVDYSRKLSPLQTLHHFASHSDSNRTPSFASPTIPGSEASLSDIPRSQPPPPAIFEAKCACASRPGEKHIFNAHFASRIPDEPDAPFKFDDNIVTIETCSNCEVGENKVQIYETLPQDPNTKASVAPMMWWVTRRLVVSYLSGTPEKRRCSSFWLPLADIQFKLEEDTVTLRWSDCNQMTERRSGNYGQHYDWVYDPNCPNNIITLRFNHSSDARQFIDVARLPYEDGTTISHGRRIDVSECSEVHTFDIGRPGIRNYRVATLTTVTADIGTSKLFVLWPEVDLDIRIHDSQTDRYSDVPDYQMTIDIKNVATPTYHSDIRDEPAADHEKVATLSKALQLKTNLVVTFPIGVKLGLPIPPPGAVEMLYGVSGWSLRYFAIVTKFKLKTKRFGFKKEKYGRADVMLWEREIEDNALGSKRRGTVVTFRLHEETDLLWMTGMITQSTEVSYPTGFDATITVANKTRGKLIDIGKMTAIASEGSPKASSHGHSRHVSESHEEYSDLVLTFEEDPRYRLEFVKLIEEFKAAATAAAPLTRRLTSASEVRRINSLSSGDIHKSPPLR